jgi:hypothetical protein
VDSCAVVEAVHEAAVNALPKLLECVDLLRDVQTIVGSQQSRDRIRAALASLEDPS